MLVYCLFLHGADRLFDVATKLSQAYRRAFLRQRTSVGFGTAPPGLIDLFI